MARTIVGIVVSDKADKTIVLSETVRKTHPLYKKQYSRSTKYIAHDEKNEANIGDTVEVKQVRPISKRKSLALVRIVQKAKLSAKDTVEAVTATEESTGPDTKTKKKVTSDDTAKNEKKEKK